MTTKKIQTPVTEELEVMRVCVEALKTLRTEDDRDRVMDYLTARHRDRNAWPASQLDDTDDA